MKPSFQLAAVACALSLALAGCSQSTPSTSSTESVQQSQTVKQYDAETFFDTTSIMGSSFSPKGDKILVSSDESGIYSLYEVDIKTAKKTRLTDFEDSTYAVLISLKMSAYYLLKTQAVTSVITSTFAKQMAQLKILRQVKKPEQGLQVSQKTVNTFL